MSCRPAGRAHHFLFFFYTVPSSPCSSSTEEQLAGSRPAGDACRRHDSGGGGVARRGVRAALEPAGRPGAGVRGLHGDVPDGALRRAGHGRRLRIIVVAVGLGR